MGFLDSLGGVVGKLAAQQQEVNQFKGEYEHMSNQELLREREDLTRKANEILGPQDAKYRLMAVKTILSERSGN